MARDGQLRRYLDRAAAMAAERGLTPKERQIEKAADALRDADLAEYRVKTWHALHGTDGGAS